MSRKIVITGASSEIGIAICQRVLQSSDVAILHANRSSDRLRAVIESSLIVAKDARVVTSDFSNEADLNSFCLLAKETDILINAAAVTTSGILPAISDSEIHEMLQVNVVALVKICRAAIPYMLSTRKGHIVNISSITATRACRGQSVYAGTKGFVESFTRAIAAEYGTKGISANCVAPGAVDAGSLRETLSYAGDVVRSSNSMARLGRPEEIASVVAFLCGEGASFINGKVLGVDGGCNLGV